MRRFGLDPTGKVLLHIGPNQREVDWIKANMTPKLHLVLDLDTQTRSVSLPGDATRIPLADRSVDLVIAWHVLEHIRNDFEAIAEIKRVLKEDACLLMSVPIFPPGRAKTFEDSTTPRSRALELYGDEDHVRAPGLDYGSRFEDESFAMTPLSVRDLMTSGGAEDVKRNGLSSSHVAWCFRRNSSTADAHDASFDSLAHCVPAGLRTGAQESAGMIAARGLDGGASATDREVESPTVPNTSHVGKGAAAVYFPGLNGIRAIAACGVVVSHTIRALNHFYGHRLAPHERYHGLDLANHAVIMFFTLSGFLITFLLLQEQARFGRVDVKAFYLRRILRIWPLYFFYIGAALLYHWMVPNPLAPLNAPFVLLYILFLPNIAYNLGRVIPDTAALWSIGIEEQFYAFWPLVVSRVRSLRRFLCALIVGILGIRLAMHLTVGGGKHLATSIVDSLGYDSMAIGALLAVLYRDGNQRLRRLADSWVPHVAFAGLVVLLIFNKLESLSLLGSVVTSVVTAAFILAQVAGRKKLIDLEQPGLSYIGKISFGIYVYHMLMITLVARMLNVIAPSTTLPAPVIIFLVSLVTIGVASLSYRYLESPFLRLKDALARIKTAPRAPESFDIAPAGVAVPTVEAVPVVARA